MFKTNYYIVLMTVFCVVAIAVPIQELAPRPGYVPVYIREGNTPLSQVNPKLVEAFHEDGDTFPMSIENEKLTAAFQAKVKEIPKQKPEDKEDEIKEEVRANDVRKATLAEVNQEKANTEETEASDIAEFTSDDIKILADEKTDN